MLTIKIDSEGVRRRLRDLADKQVRFAAARALTATARQAVTDVQTAMQTTFDRPTPFTLKAFYAKPATTKDLTAWVGTRENAPGGTPAGSYLYPQFFGGTRSMKRFERRLSGVSGDQFAVPANAAPLDQFGNVSRGTIMQMMSRLDLRGDKGKNMSARTARQLARQGLVAKGRDTRSDFFVARRGANGQPYGIYRLVSKGVVKPLFFFTASAPSYRQVLDLEAIINKSAAENFEKNFDAAFKEALRTAR